MAQLQQATINATQFLDNHLRERRQCPERVEKIDAQIRDRLGATRAVVVLDMVGFSRQTETAGIIATLAKIQHLQEILVPTLEAQGGQILKLEADNAYALFESADLALAATDALLHRLNLVDLHASIGIGYGELLLVGERDAYGAEMNLASKLGEDIAGPDQILLTAAAHSALTNPVQEFTVRTVTVSDLELTLHQLVRNSVSPTSI
jgi:adenylate cyclase